jgi:acetyltransferase-like isoleucine patch superfamily enzyme
MVMNKEKINKWEEPKIEERKLHPKYFFLVQNRENLALGENTDIGAFTYINAKNGVIIEKNVQIGSHCSIYTISTIDDKNGKVIIKENARIGTHSTIMPGVTIGRNSIIGAHSFVNKNIPDNSICYGVPIKIIGKKKK